MRNYFRFGSYRSDYNFNAYISGPGVFNAPARAVDEITIPGRDGLFLGPDNRLENIDITYPCFIYKDFRANIAKLKDYLMSYTNYTKLTDTYYPNEYRMGILRGPVEVEPTAKLDAGSFDLTFNCMPQRFLNSGDETITITSSGYYVFNPTHFPSKPTLQVTGPGYVKIGDTTITLLDSRAYNINCATGNASTPQGQSLNNRIKLDTKDFPTLAPNVGTRIFFGDGVTSVKITPRWWTI